MSIGLILIIQTIITASLIGYILNSFLFSYIIIIIILRGALVLFIYIARIARNEKFKLSINNSFIILIRLIILITYIYLNNKIFIINHLGINDELRLIKIFNTKTAQITITIIIYLLLTIIAVSNIAKTTEGPLRIKSKYE